MDEQLLLNVQHVNVKFSDHIALQDISLTVKRGDIITLIGPNGAGKSTLVRVVLNLLKPDSGHVEMQPDITIGYMPQKLTVDRVLPLTVKRFLTLTGVTDLTTIQNILEEVSATQVLNRSLHQLSGGEMQRVLLARALLRQPDLLVLDEPIQGVDITGQYELYELIANIRTQRHCGILMVSHDLHLVMSATDYVICLNQRVCCSGHPEKITQNPAYVDLFGARAVKDLAIYQHHHSQSNKE